MGTITRRLPISNQGRYTALFVARNKKSTVSSSQNPLSADTSNRLETTFTEYNSKLNLFNAAKVNYHLNTPLKEAARQKTKQIISHYFQVLNFGVERGIVPAAHRGYYGIDKGDATVPSLNSDTEILYWGDKIIIGEAARINAGGIPMAWPSVEEVKTDFETFKNTFSTQSTLADELDVAEEQLNILNPAVDSLIKRIWAEVEARYSEETIESRRNNAREWGIVYVSVGKVSTLNITILRADTGTPVGEAGLHLTAADIEGTTDSEGKAQLKTSVEGDDVIQITPPAGSGLKNLSIPVNIPEGSVKDFIFELQPENG